MSLLQSAMILFLSLLLLAGWQVVAKAQETPAVDAPQEQTDEPAAEEAEALPRFPSVTGDNLEEETFNLPEDFAGELNLVMVAFQRWHQRDVDTWLPLARELADEFDGLAYYELPTISRLYRPARRFIDGGMRAGIPDPVARATTITLYIDVAAFQAELGIPNSRSIHVFLVNANGEVVWRAEGPSNEAMQQVVRDFVAEHLPATSEEEPPGDEVPEQEAPDGAPLPENEPESF